jgi:glycine/D-amino acid oxidase-like deaminating enzyme
VVVGAGVVGVTSAYRLAQAGAEVTLIEAGGVGSGASGASFAHVNASYAGYWEYVELRRAGLEGYRRLRTETDGASWWHETGYLAVHSPGSPVEELDTHLDRLRASGYPAVRIEGPPSEVEPALETSEAERVYHFPNEGFVDLPAMLDDLSARAGHLGVEVCRHDPVASVMTSDDEVTGLQLRSGRSIACEEVVVCCGRWTDELLAAAGVETDLVAHHSAAGTPVPGLMIVTDAVRDSVHRVVSVDDVNCRPFGVNQTMVWSGAFDRRLVELGGTDAAPDRVSRLATELLAAAGRHVPALRSAQIDRAIVAMRAMPADGLPVVGALGQIRGLYVVLAHAAATMAPVLADLVVTEVVHGQVDPRLDRFRPDRLPLAPRASAGARSKEAADDFAGNH